MKQNLNAIDLFCGCGGISLGFQNAGYDIIGGLDFDDDSLLTYSRNFPDAQIMNQDISKAPIKDIFSGISVEDINIVAGGPPCQGFSLSGLREYNDSRNILFKFFIESVEYLKPDAVLLENVPGFISLYKGAAKDILIERLAKLGYIITFRALNSQHYGVPQSRKRVFFVGLKNNEEFIFPEPTHFPKGSIFSSNNGNQFISAEDAISDLPVLLDDLGKEIQNYFSPPNTEYQKIMRFGSELLFNHVGTKHTQKTRDIINLVPDGGNYKDLPDDLKNTRNFNVAWTRYNSKLPSPTIDTGHRHHFHYKHNRVPTVRESARLQSFPDTFVFEGSKTSQYRQVGNAVPPILVESIARRIMEHL